VGVEHLVDLDVLAARLAMLVADWDLWGSGCLFRELAG
jgi:hypothetical protein